MQVPFFIRAAIHGTIVPDLLYRQHVHCMPVGCHLFSEMRKGRQVAICFQK